MRLKQDVSLPKTNNHLTEKTEINNLTQKNKPMKKIFLAAIIGLATLNANAVRKIVSTSTATLKTEQITVDTQVSRYFIAGYNTICLPFSVSAEDLQQAVGEGVMLEKLVGVEGSELLFMDVTEGGIEAGKPYLIYCPTTKFAYFTNKDSQVLSQPSAITVGGVSMTSYFNTAKPTGIWGIPAKQDTDILQSVLVEVNSDKQFLPTRCGISCKNIMNPVIKHIASMNGGETIIANLYAKNAVVDVYSTNGTLVSKGIRMNDTQSLPKGIYVVNGVKFMVK